MTDVQTNWIPSPTTGDLPVSFSQNAEDIRLARVFGAADGFYVDVGAGDPDEYSVTKLFYDRGWSGINVEPGPAFEQLARERARDVNLNVAALPDEGFRDFWVSHPHSGLSTSRGPEPSAPLPDGFSFERKTVECAPLSRILAEHASGRTIDFLTVDVEGAEADVIRSIDFEAARPRVLVVEAISPLTFEPNHEGWEALLLEAGYAFSVFDGINRFYVDKDDRDLVPILAYPMSALEPYVTAASVAEVDQYRSAIDAMVRSRTWRVGRTVAAATAPAARLARRLPSRRPRAPFVAPPTASSRLDAAARARALERVDLSAHNASGRRPAFANVVSQVVSAGQFSDPDFVRLRRVVYPNGVPSQDARLPGLDPHRKTWESVYVLRAAEQSGMLRPGFRALGFGVGREPIPAALARFGLTILATDLDAEAERSELWATSGQHMSDVASLTWPDVVPDDVLERLVSTRSVDMNDVPDELGHFDLIWSCCALEHLGSPHAGLDFVARTLDLLEPGGVSVHTTELELTARDETADWGHLAVYRPQDLDRLAERVRGLGFEIETNWYVSMDTPADRWIALPPYPDGDPAHLKLLIGDSVSTSVGILVRRPLSP